MDNYDNDEEEDQDKQYQQYEIKEGIIFLIEITPGLLMSDTGIDSHSQLFEILSSINDLMSELIITMKNTGVGIYFYNCSSSSVLNSMNQPPGFFKLFRLNVLNLQNMKKLNDIIQDNSITPLESYFKHKPIEDENHLSVVLNKMIDEFSVKTEFNRKKLIWITTNDKPYTKTSTKENLWRIINDFYNYNFYIQTLFLDTTNKKFDIELYKDVFLNTSFLKRSQQQQQEEEEEIPPSKDSQVKSLLSNQIRQSIFRIKEIRRIQFSCNLILSDGGTMGGNLGCSIKGYTLYSHEKYKKDLLLYTKEESIKKVFLDSKLTSDNGAIELVKNDKTKSIQEVKEQAGIRKGYPIGGNGDIIFLNKDQLEFINNYAFDHKLQEEEQEDFDDEEEKSYVSTSQPPYLKLLGFRDIQNFNPVYSCGSPIFVTGDTDNGLKTTSLKGGYSNSLETLGSLYRSCVKLQQYAIVFGCIKRNSQPYLYGLYPTQTKNSTKLSSEKGDSDLPQGFLLIKLPWIDDIRSLPQDFITETSHDEPDKELVNHFKSLFKNYFLENYNPNQFPNPSLNYFYKVIKHEILQMELTLQDRKLSNNDITIQKLIQLKSQFDSDASAQDIINNINSKLNEFEERVPKRVVEDVKPAKKVKVELDESAVLVKWNQGSLNDFTMDQLKTFAKKYPEIKIGSKKAEMVENISNFLDSRERK
ncbi:ATP-dependent DNA helicase II subunit 1 [Spathaspora sp. JA1]|nr:ATP-dependent DNA helicase II subunit 1 [Spathaspora sp. JA1]